MGFLFFCPGPIKNAKCWAGNTDGGGAPGKGGGPGAAAGSTKSAGRQLGNERHFSRLLYCITFFHSALNERALYGTRGGLSKPCFFGSHDLDMAVYFLEVREGKDNNMMN